MNDSVYDVVSMHGMATVTVNTGVDLMSRVHNTTAHRVKYTCTVQP